MTAGAGEALPGVTGTSRRIRGAIAGDGLDLEWVVARLSPVLLHQARYRMKDRLRRVCDPEDVVSHAWQVSLPRLAGLTARDGRYTPVILRFLSTAVLLRVNELLRREARRPPEAAGAAGEGSSPLPVAPGPGVWSEIVHRERAALVAEALDALSPADREVIVLRLVEQRTGPEVGALLGIDAGTVAVRLHRALGRLRARLPSSVFDDIAEEAE